MPFNIVFVRFITDFQRTLQTWSNDWWTNLHKILLARRIWCFLRNLPIITIIGLLSEFAKK